MRSSLHLSAWLGLIFFWAFCQDVSGANLRNYWLNELKSIYVANHEYEAMFRRLPMDKCDAQGQPIFSWRVALLPFLEQGHLYNEIIQVESWADPKIAKYLFPQPGVYYCPYDDRTLVARVLGEGTFFGDGKKPVSFGVKRDLSRVMLWIECDAGPRANWMKPHDWWFDPNHPRKGLIKDRSHPRYILKEKGCFAMFGDGQVRFLSEKLDVAQFRALLGPEKEQFAVWDRGIWQAVAYHGLQAWFYPVLGFSLVTILGGIVVGIRFQRRQQIAPGEFFWVIGAMQQFVYLLALFFVYRDEAVPLAVELNDSVPFWFFPGIAASCGCLLGVAVFWQVPTWRFFFLAWFVVYQVIVLPALHWIGTDPYFAPEEALLDLGTPSFFLTVALVALVISLIERKFTAWRHWLGFTFLVAPWLWFTFWENQGIAFSRSLFNKIID